MLKVGFETLMLLTYPVVQMCTVGKATLSWSSRVQIALDAARGLEYIHEHTKPTYIHRDIKSANILLDKECHAKVLVQSCGKIWTQDWCLWGLRVKTMFVS